MRRLIAVTLLVVVAAGVIGTGVYLYLKAIKGEDTTISQIRAKETTKEQIVPRSDATIAPPVPRGAKTSLETGDSTAGPLEEDVPPRDVPPPKEDPRLPPSISLPSTGQGPPPNREKTPPQDEKQPPPPPKVERLPPQAEKQPAIQEGAPPSPKDTSPPSLQESKSKDRTKAIAATPKKGDDLPDVSIVIPEETRPEVKAILKDNAISLSTGKPAERVKAAHVLGELGEQGKPARGLLCRAMLDPAPAVATAAADALKNIDPKIQYLAVAFLTEKDRNNRRALLTKIQGLKEDSEPLSILVAHRALRSAATGDKDHLLAAEITALSLICKNDLNAYRLIAAALDYKDEHVRHGALEALPRMKHGRLAIRKLIAILQTDTINNRIAAIEALVAAAEESNEEIVSAAIAAQRYHENERVRKAVEVALNKLQNEQKPR